jgi:hypothetical protein
MKSELVQFQPWGYTYNSSAWRGEESSVSNNGLLTYATHPLTLPWSASSEA